MAPRLSAREKAAAVYETRPLFSNLFSETFRRPADGSVAPPIPLRQLLGAPAPEPGSADQAVRTGSGLPFSGGSHRLHRRPLVTEIAERAPPVGNTRGRARSEERRVGKECRSGWGAEHGI